MFFLRLGIKAGIDSLPFAFFCNQKQKKMNYKMNGEEYMSN